MKQTSFILILILILTYSNLFSQAEKKYSINGYIQDEESGEKLIGCVVLDSISKQGTTTNSFGYFNLIQTAGKRVITIHFLGYTDKSVRLNLNKDTTLIIKLSAQAVGINEVVVTSSLGKSKLSKPQTGLLNISSKDVKRMPALLGEADVMRTLQTLPGIQAANERSTGISVRGGSIDQNLFLLDDAPVFQISHVGGFYSVFNNEAIKDIKVYKGDIPANYGGRLSSVVDIRLKDGNMQKYEVSGGIGLVAANLSVEGPILRDRISFIVSGKYSYTGLVFKSLNSNTDISFYDLNCKLNAIINNKNRIYISSYYGGDKFNTDKNNNKTFTLRWNHVYNPKLFSNVSLIYSNYGFKSGNTNTTNNYTYTWQSGLKQVTIKADNNYYFNSKNTANFGISSSYINFIPGKLEGSEKAITNVTESVPFNNRVVDEQGVLDHALYISNQQKLTEKLSLRYGIRAGLYQNLSMGQWVYKLDDYQVADSFYVDKNETYSNYYSVEPRISLNYRLWQNSAIKASYTYTTQQTQLLMKTNGGGTLDVWFPSGVNIKPQTSSQYSLGFVQYLFSGLLEASIEGYYKKMNNIIDYKDGATFLAKNSVLDINKTSYNYEEQLRIGKGYAYGAELMIKGGYNRIDGFMSYTYARSKRIIEDINSGEPYLSPFDKPHTFNFSLNYNVSKRVSLSANFRYQSGQVTTVPVYVMEMWGKTLSGYSNRNEYRLPAYQRLDLSMNIKNRKKRNKNYNGEWNISVINALNHANINYVEFVPSKVNPNIIDAKGIYMFGIIPSISYHFNF